MSDTVAALRARPLQDRVLDYFKARERTNLPPPTFNELSTSLGITKSTAYAAVVRLVNGGVLAKQRDSVARPYMLTRSQRELVAIEAFEEWWPGGQVDRTWSLTVWLASRGLGD